MPTYNESPTRIMAGLEAIDEALRSLDASDHFDIFILERYDTTRNLDRGGKGIPGLARPNRRCRADFLPASRQKHGKESRQHRRMGGAVRRRLPPVPDPGRRQRDAGRHAGCSGPSDGGASGCRADPNPADHHRRHDPVCPDAAVRRAGIWPGDRAWHRMVAWVRRATTGATMR